MKNFYIGLLIICLISQSGCSLFFGNVKPVEEKSSAYGILDLSKDADWKKLSTRNMNEDAAEEIPESGVSDLAFQSQKTAAIISINSACKSYRTGEGAADAKNVSLGLKKLTQGLLLGITGISLREEKLLTVEEVPALETTIQGKLNGENVKLRTVVLQRGKCVYDLMYVSRPGRFEDNEKDFSRFISSLRLK